MCVFYFLGIKSVNMQFVQSTAEGSGTVTQTIIQFGYSPVINMSSRLGPNQMR